MLFDWVLNTHTRGSEGGGDLGMSSERTMYMLLARIVGYQLRTFVRELIRTSDYTTLDRWVWWKDQKGYVVSGTM